MKRFSIASLMTLVVLVAVGIAALRNASDSWAGVMLLATLALLGTSILGVVYRRDAHRAFCLGFGLFGWGYVTLALGPWFSDRIAPGLPTTQAFDYLHAQAMGQPMQVTLAGNVLLNSSTTILSADSLTMTLNPGQANPRPLTLGQDSPSTYIKRIASLATPGLLNYEPFLRIGHCLSTLIAALLGGWIGRWLQRTCLPALAAQ